MTKSPMNTSYLRYAAYFLGVGSAALFTIRCGSGISMSPPPVLASGGSGAVGGCTNDSWCMTYDKRVCSDMLKVKCVAGQCIHALKISNTPPCMCIAGDIAQCTAGTGSIKTCYAVAGSGGAPAASWGGCGPCPP